MTPLTITLDVSPKVLEGLADGTLERIGSIIRDSRSKAVIYWLREAGEAARGTDVAPLPAESLKILDKLGMSADAMIGLQTVNIAATIASTVIIMRKLGELDRKLDVIVDQLKAVRRDVSWTREVVDGDLLARVRGAARKLSLPLYAEDHASLRLILGDLIEVGELLHSRRDLLLDRGEAYAETDLFGIYSEYLDLCVQLQLGAAWRVGSAGEAAMLAYDWTARLEGTAERLRAPIKACSADMSKLGLLVLADDSRRDATSRNLRALRIAKERAEEQALLLDTYARAGITPADLEAADAANPGALMLVQVGNDENGPDDVDKPLPIAT